MGQPAGFPYPAFVPLDASLCLRFESETELEDEAHAFWLYLSLPASPSFQRCLPLDNV